MKKIYKILLGLLWFIMFSWLVYATVTIANTNKSTFLPWQWIRTWYHDSAHNVWATYLAEDRFIFLTWSLWAGNNWVIKDNVTNLIWQSYARDSWVISWKDAKTYCRDLVLWGETEWRLPNLKEITSIIDLSRFAQSLNWTYFTTTWQYYWTSNTHATYTESAWRVSFYYGQSGYLYKTYPEDVICVR